MSQNICPLCGTEIDHYAIGFYHASLQTPLKAICFYYLSYAAVCNHTKCCALCIYRLRKFFNIKQCLICNQDLPTVIFSQTPSKKFAEYQLETLPEDHHDTTISAYFVDEDFLHMIKELTKNRCIICNSIFDTFDNLQHHITSQHHRDFWFLYFVFCFLLFLYACCTAASV